jgi:choice-of-anchor C domain-containing protein
MKNMIHLTIAFALIECCVAADEPLSRVAVAKIGKAATALVEIKAKTGYASAFCVHHSGLFVTNAHVADTDAFLVLDPGGKNEKRQPARMLRSDKGLDLALLQVEGVDGLSTIALGSDEKLEDLMEVIGFGFPFGTKLAQGGEYPSVSVNVGTITSLRYQADKLHRIQLDAALNPGNSGGPVLDRSGKLVGVVVGGVRNSGVNFAIPVSAVSRFLASPVVKFVSPVVGPANVHKPVLFEANVWSLVPPAGPLSVELLLKPAGGTEQRHRMQAEGNTYRVTVVPLPPKIGSMKARLSLVVRQGEREVFRQDQSLIAGQSDNLIVNGSFEEGPAVGGFLPLNPGSTAIRGWTVTRGSIDYIGTHWAHADGKRSVDLHGSPGYGGIEQTISTAKRQRYRISFSLAGSAGGAFPPRKIGVSAAGQTAAFTFIPTGKEADGMGWTTKQWEFDAVDSQTTLEFYTLEKSAPVAGPALDNVRVEPVP